MTEKSIVLTMYGKDETIETISVSLIKGDHSYSGNSNALRYCLNINELKLNGNQWIYARIINENEKIVLSKPPKFDIINRLADYSVQALISEAEHWVLVKALKTAEESIKEKIFKNMSEKAAVMLKEDIETLKNIENDEIQKSRNQIIEIILKRTEQGVYNFQ